jgi:hypothetical protein
MAETHFGRAIKKRHIGRLKMISTSVISATGLCLAIAALF